MQAPKRATKAVLGAGSVVGIGTVLTMLWNAIDNVEARATAQHDKDVALIRVEEKEKDERIYRELCLIRFRMDVQAGVPNPGGCGK